MGAEVGVVMVGPEQLIVKYASKLGFAVSNNGAEYEAVIASLDLAEVDILALLSDSQLVTDQVNNNIEAKKPVMVRYLEKV